MPLLVTDEATAQVLRGARHEVVVATDGKELLDQSAALKPELIVLETTLPIVSGLEVVRRLKQDARRTGEWLPVLFLAARSDVTARIEGLRAGAEDFLGRPYDPLELLARVEALLRTRRFFDEAHRGRAELEEYAIHDRLTGLYNQRYLTQRLDEEFRRAAKLNEPMSLLAIDLDELERVNSRFGRGAGDRLLEACARAVSTSCRDLDLVARAGGDEFVAVLPNAHLAVTLAIAERTWVRLRATQVEERGAQISCDASVGVACYPNRDVGSATDLLRLAHTALARAKAEGRGRICVYQHQGYMYQPEP